MSDFLAAFPSISMNDYIWELSIPLITIMSCDKSRIDYDSDEKDNNNNQITPTKGKAISSPQELASLFGF